MKSPNIITLTVDFLESLTAAQTMVILRNMEALKGDLIRLGCEVNIDISGDESEEQFDQEEGQ